jgi:hypothetical protein
MGILNRIGAIGNDRFGFWFGVLNTGRTSYKFGATQADGSYKTTNGIVVLQNNQ